MEVEPQPSYSWWWNSHNKPRQSAWLQTTLADLDNKTKAMLSLIQEEADSFAKRADMYYTRRPELINLIEQFYRAHRSLAERYDHLKEETKHLKGETKQNAQKAVKFQFQDALSYDGFLETPFAKDQIVANESVNQGLQEEISMHDSSESDSEISEVDNTEPQVYKIKNEEISDQDNESVSASDSEVDNPVDEAAETVNINSRLREMESRISYLEDENSRLLRRLTMKSLKSKHLKEKIRRLKKEKSFFKEELFFVDREKSLLQRESDIVKAEYSKLRNENEAGLQQRQVLTRKVGNLHKKNQRLSEQNKVMSTVLGFVNGQAASMARSNVILRNEIQQGNQEAEAIIQSLKDEKKNAEIMFEAEGKLVSEQNAKIEELQSEVRILAEQNREQQGNQEAEAIIQSLKDEKKNAEIMFEAEGKLVSEQNAKIEELQSEVRILAEQNREQDIQLLERNEEKREVIRQLSFALEVLRDKNQRLEEALRNSRAGALCKVNTHDSASSQFSTWKKFLAAAWWGGPPPQNHIPARCNFGSLSLNLSEKHTAKVLSLRE